jgi:hypothetical protein
MTQPIGQNANSHPMTGIIPNLPAAEYHARPEISKHGLDDFHRCPAWFKYRRENPQETTPALRWGSIVDEAVFTPTEFAANSVVLPADAPSRPTERNRKAKKPSEETIKAIEFWDKFDAENAGREVITAEENIALTRTFHAIHGHPSAAKLFDCGERLIQSSLFWTDPQTGVAMRARPDMIVRRPEQDRDIIVDLKTAVSAAPEDFGKAANAWRYHVQAAIYSAAWKQITSRDAAFVFIVVEKSAPFLVACYVASPRMLATGEKHFRRDLAAYAACLESGNWPGYADTIQELELPAWADRD